MEVKMNNQPLLENKYYRQAETQKHGFLWKLLFSWFFPLTTFNLRFPEIKNSLIDASMLKRFFCLLHWKLFIKNQSTPKNAEEVQRLLPMTKPKFQTEQNQIKYTWIGHSTAVISFGKDANFIIDPVFSKRCSPSQFIGPKRFRPPACQVNQLPPIDAVLVSHDHYDHLDTVALNNLYKKSLTDQNKVSFFAGLQSEDVFPKNSEIITLNWTQSKEITIKGKKFKITFVPVCHWGRRGLFDQNKRLWGGFVIQSPTSQRVFYSGDTGYCGIFKEIGNIFQSFDLAILPIGAYKPRQYLRNQHINPEQAVKVHQQLRSKKSVGVHWGTFPLGNQHFVAARQDLQAAKRKHGLRDEEFITVGHGQSFSVNYDEAIRRMEEK